MRVPEPEQEKPISWKAVLEHTQVHDAEGQSVGTVREVLGSESQDIFHGIVVHSGVAGRDVMLPADVITRITNRRIDTSLPAERIRELPPYREEESYQLGFVGLFRKHLGWVRDKDDNPLG